ncbi:bifunctional 2-C-methyl-D-erythritol 4-phosphate cytidylyltransferase/2-C-methyl-D-erythritol 2,4-cyclodiphosphate synthase [Phreatobacter sp.]|uniref:bifunctional 2-C-methyl-D-erythritol 4-phosphate cytidylyltransferase/2-C-methyl-D-erythritol 2,4-cyclodiphosphate synthase n=1 Tax=Phreatobacter sp. TaxID=1966341 RepID=UPI003F6FCAFA
MSASATLHAARPVVAVLVVAAGRGLRAGGEVPKQYRDLAGRPVLAHALATFATHPAVDVIQVVIDPSDRAHYDMAVKGLEKLAQPVAGGAARQDSVRLGLEQLAAEPPEMVLIHDGARPFVDGALIDRAIAAVTLEGAVAAVPGVPVTDTIKRVDPAGAVCETPSRDLLRAVQTPQAFRFDLLLAAHRKQAGAGLTDDAAVMEAAGHAVMVFTGDPGNMKLTHPEDFALAERRLSPPQDDIRTGQGYDVHAFGPGDHVWLGGIRIPHEAGVLAHSDGDVVLHAATDAILGALADGDIGSHFPPSDPQWKGASSDRFLAHAAALVAGRGGRIAHLDVTVVCERPKVGPHREAMRARIAEILAIAPDRVAIKATTSERLGFTGRGEGLAALAIATVRLPGL